MATAKQIEANRLNAAKSTGPKSVEGKAISRLNAVTHGLASELPEVATFIEEGRAKYQELQAKWRSELRPDGVEQEWLFETIVAESVRVERCHQAFFAQCAQHARRAHERWDADRIQDAETLATGLAKNPSLVASRLAATPQGCDLMIGRWAGLRASLDRHKTWTDPQRSHALDLLGVHPDFRDAETPVDPSKGDIFEVRSRIVESEIRRLTEVRESAVGFDKSERDLAEQSLGAEFTKPVQLLDRYERNAIRRQQWAWKRFDAAKRGDGPKAAKPVPSITPTVRAIAPKPPEPVVLAISAPKIEPTAPAEVVRYKVEWTPQPVARNRQQRRAQAAIERRA